MALVLIATTGVSCALFKTTKNNVALDKRSAKLEWSGKQVVNSKTEKNSNSLLLRRDSGTNTFSVRIWPKGVFTFSVDQGFEGIADSIAWYGSHEEIRIFSLQQQSLEKNKINAETSLKAKSAKKTDQSKMTKESWLSWKWITAGLLGMILVLWYVFRRIYI